MPRAVMAAVARARGQPLTLERLTLADPGPGEVLVKVLAAGLCHSDLNIMDGDRPAPYPCVVGHEAVGEIVACGPGVERVAPGDRVLSFLIPECGTCDYCRSGRTNLCRRMIDRMARPSARFSRDGERITQFASLGMFADHTVIAADAVVPIAHDLPAHLACYVACGVATGFGSVVRAAQVERGRSVAVFGLGGVGLNAIQGARFAGADPIIAIDLNPAREAIALQLGASHVIVPHDGQDLVAAIRAIAPDGVDYSFECVGLPTLMRQALDATHPAWGRSYVIGLVADGADLQADSMALTLGRRWSGAMMGGYRLHELPALADLCVSGDLDVASLVTHRLPFGRINDGFDLMRRGETIRTVVTFD